MNKALGLYKDNVHPSLENSSMEMTKKKDYFDLEKCHSFLFNKWLEQ